MKLYYKCEGLNLDIKKKILLINNKSFWSRSTCLVKSQYLHQLTILIDWRILGYKVNFLIEIFIIFCNKFKYDIYIPIKNTKKIL